MKIFQDLNPDIKKLYNENVSDLNRVDLLKPAFQLADLDGDGRVTMDELFNGRKPDQSVLNFASFQFLVGSGNKIDIFVFSG